MAGRIVASFLVAAFALGASWNYKVEADAGIDLSGFRAGDRVEKAAY